MARNLSDTILAPITGLPPAAVVVVRLSGPEALAIGRSVFLGFPDEVAPRHLYYGAFSHGDDGMAVWFEDGKSFTGEPSCEMHVHGSVASVQALMDACVRRGARMAEPGEFTFRAVMHGKLDLTRAEGIRDTVDAVTDLQFSRANMLRDGVIAAEYRRIRSAIFKVLAAVEANTDFSEEIGPLDEEGLVASLVSVREVLAGWLASARSTEIIRSGVSMAIVGPPNAGKSSLLNALLKADRAIVTAIPGTTRDTLEASLNLGGLLVRVLDTAGLRSTSDVIEQMGIDRSRAASAAADLVLFVYDGSVGLTPADYAEIGALDSSRVLLVANKADLGQSVSGGIAICAPTGFGLGALETAVLEHFAVARGLEGFAMQTRHVPHLYAADFSCEMAIETLSSDMPTDLAAVHLREAVHQMGLITGETASEDMLDRIFADFCIGK